MVVVVVVVVLLLEEGAAARQGLTGCAAVSNSAACRPAAKLIIPMLESQNGQNAFVFRRKPQVARRVRVRLLGYVRALNQSLLKFKKTC